MDTSSMISLGALIGVASVLVPLARWLNSIENQTTLNTDRIAGIQIGLTELRRDIKQYFVDKNRDK